MTLFSDSIGCGLTTRRPLWFDLLTACLHDGDPKKMAMSFDWSVGHHSMLTRCPLMKSIRVNTLALVDQNLQCIWPSVYKLRQLIERPNLVSRGIYNFSQEMGATTEAECNQLHKAKSTSASALIGCGGRREPDWCLFFLPQPHTQIWIVIWL